MKEDESAFLLTEYQASWETIQRIDDRRGKFLSSYIVVFIAALSVTSALTQTGQSLQGPVRIAVLGILIATALAGLAIMYVLRSERRANTRYRTRINTIRDIFLARTQDGLLMSYMSVEGGHNPQGIGSTLKGIFFVLGFMVAVLAGLSVLILLPQ